MGGRIPGPSDARESFVSPGACWVPTTPGKALRGAYGATRGACGVGSAVGSAGQCGSREAPGAFSPSSRPARTGPPGGPWPLRPSEQVGRQEEARGRPSVRGAAPSRRAYRPCRPRRGRNTSEKTRCSLSDKPGAIRPVFSRPAAAKPSFLRRRSASDRTPPRSQWPTQAPLKRIDARAHTILYVGGTNAAHVVPRCGFPPEALA